MNDNSAAYRSNLPVNQPRLGAWSARAFGVIIALFGAMNVLSAIMPSLAVRLVALEQFVPLQVRYGARLASVLAGFALLSLAHGLWRRKRRAWQITLAVLLVAIVGHLLKGLDFEEAGVALALVVGLWVLRAHFHARSDPLSTRQGLRLMAGALFFTLGYGVLGFYLLDRHFSVDFGLAMALRQTVTMFTQFYDPGLQPITGFGQYFAGSIYLIGAATLGYALLALLSPVLIRQPATPAERARAHAIVEAYGCSSLARLVLFHDKSYYFSPGGSVVAFVVKGRVALALGDPIGPAGDVAAVILAFKDHCLHNDWQASFYQTLPDHLEAYKAAGFDVLCFGHEAVVDLAAFTLEGKAGKEVRAPLKRLTAAGHRAEMRPPPLSEALLHELRAVSDEWLTLVHGSELRFATGWFDDDYILSSPVMVVYAPAGHISAFANLMPEYQLNAVAVDLMRRRRGIEKNTLDFLFVALFEWAKKQGYTSFSLGLSALSGVGERPTDPTAERALHFFYEHINQFYNFKGLHAFKDKFRPQWLPRYLVYPGPASLPAIVTALVRADSGDEFPWAYLKR